MQFDKKYLRQNQFQALPLELALQIMGSILGYIFAALVTPAGLLWTTPNHLWFVIGIQIVRTACVILMSGRDSNHLVYKIAPKDPNWVFVGPEFHTLHHVYPDRYIGSFVKILDWICGTAYSFRGKRFAITGANGAFGQAIVSELEREGVKGIRKFKFGTDWDHDNFENVIPVLAGSDILILADGCKEQGAVESNCNSAVQLVKLFKKYRATHPAGPTLPEVWYVGNEMEFHQPWGNMQQLSGVEGGFLPYARLFTNDHDILYRHIVLSTFQSSVVTADTSAHRAAKYAMWWIRRGATYVPITYTGTACLNYLKFMFYIPYAQDV
ncbi:hypothetical protein N7490_002780 [Penicillium lividum]|nr:hypothetical protein N7490_002780 [Penicillium lividum]